MRWGPPSGRTVRRVVPTTAHESHSRILIAGAGPTGLALGLCLRAYGIDADIVDPKAGPTRDSKAVAISPLARHQLALIGEDGTIGREALALDRLEVRRKEGEDDAVDLLWFDDAKGSFLMQPQRVTERDLIERLARRGTRVFWRRSVTSLLDRGDHVLAELVDARGNSTRRRYDYVVGCDGKGSPVRDAIGSQLHDIDFPLHLVLGDVELDWDEGETEARVLADGDGFFAFLPLGARRWRVVASQPGAPKAGRTRVEQLIDPVCARLGRDPFAARPTWMSRTRLRMRVADRLRKGRLFIAGDAAHQFPPLGTLGLGGSLADALNLGWKLALCVLGEAPEPDALLESYEQERLPAALADIEAANRDLRRLTGTSSLRSESFPRLRASEVDTAREDRFPLSPTGLALRYGRSTALASTCTGETGRFNRGLSSLLATTLAGRHRPALRIIGFPPPGRFAKARHELARLCSTPSVDYVEIHTAAQDADEPELPTVRVDEATWRRLGAREGRLLIVRPDGVIGFDGDYPDADLAANYVRGLIRVVEAPVPIEPDHSLPALL